MESLQFPESVQLWANDVLVWIGFGTIVGLLARAIMPGRDPGGAISTLLMGIGGTMIGCGMWSYFYSNSRVTPISPMGFCVATAGAFVILFFYKLLGGYRYFEGGSSRRYSTSSSRRRYRSSRYRTADLDD